MKKLLIAATLLFFGMAPSLTHAACSAPAANEGDQVYNTTHKTMQFCNGTDWIAMGGISPAAGGGGGDWTLLGIQDSTFGGTCNKCDTGLDLSASYSAVLFIAFSQNISSKSVATTNHVAHETASGCSVSSDWDGDTCVLLTGNLVGKTGTEKTLINLSTYCKVILDVGDNNIYYSDTSANEDCGFAFYYR